MTPVCSHGRSRVGQRSRHDQKRAAGRTRARAVQEALRQAAHRTRRVTQGSRAYAGRQQQAALAVAAAREAIRCPSRAAGTGVPHVVRWAARSRGDAALGRGIARRKTLLRHVPGPGPECAVPADGDCPGLSTACGQPYGLRRAGVLVTCVPADCPIRRSSVRSRRLSRADAGCPPGHRVLVGSRAVGRQPDSQNCRPSGDRED